MLRSEAVYCLQAGARGEQLAGFVKDQGHEAALHMNENTDKAAQMLTDAARKVRYQLHPRCNRLAKAMPRCYASAAIRRCERRRVRADQQSSVEQDST